MSTGWRNVHFRDGDTPVGIDERLIETRGANQERLSHAGARRKHRRATMIEKFTGALLGVVGDDTEHGPEDLFLCDRHVVLDIDEHRWLHEVARLETHGTTLAAGEQFGALLNAFADVGLYALVLLLRHHGSDGGLGISGIADCKSVHRLLYGRLHGV